MCFFLTFLYNYHELDVYGQKIAFTSKTLTITETKIKTFCTIKKRPTSPTCNLPGGGGGDLGKGRTGKFIAFLTVEVAEWITKIAVGTVL